MTHFLSITLLVSLLAAYSYLINRVIPKQFYTVSNLLISLIAIVYVRFLGLSWVDIGFAPGKLLGGLAWGLALGLPIFAAIMLSSRYKPAKVIIGGKVSVSSNLRAILFELCVRIPFGTALSEEILFRGALLGLLINYYNHIMALIISSIIFGLWHILPTLKDIENNDGLDKVIKNKLFKRYGSVTATFIATFLAGLALGWIRLVSGSLAAPWIIHTLINISALGSGYLVIWRKLKTKS